MRIRRKTATIDGVGDMETRMNNMTANGLRWKKAAQTRNAALGLWEGLSHSTLLHLIVIVLKSHSASLCLIVIVLKVG